MIGNITAVPEIGKVYLGKVVRLAEFGAFVELFPGTDGLLHISEIAEHRVKEVKDELREGDQVMVKVLAIEGNRIKLSRKALIKEQKAKLAPAAPVAAEARRHETHARIHRLAAAASAPPRHEFDERQPRSNQSTILIEGGDDFDEVKRRGDRRRKRAQLQPRRRSPGRGRPGRRRRPSAGCGGATTTAAVVAAAAAAVLMAVARADSRRYRLKRPKARNLVPGLWFSICHSVRKPRPAIAPYLS